MAKIEPMFWRCGSGGCTAIHDERLTLTPNKLTMNANSIGDVASGCSLAILIVICLVVLYSFPTMLLWNWLMPTIFGLPQITFWQAMGLNALSSMLFGSRTSSNSK